jgi:hypothetical protein
VIGTARAANVLKRNPNGGVRITAFHRQIHFGDAAASIAGDHKPMARKTRKLGELALIDVQRRPPDCSSFVCCSALSASKYGG